MKNLIRVASFLFIALNISCREKVSIPKPGTTLKVASISGAALREDQNIQSETIEKLDFVDEVDFIRSSDSIDTILGTQGYWYNVKSGVKTGWIFSALLKTKTDSHVVIIEDNKIIKKPLKGLVLEKLLKLNGRLNFELNSEEYRPPAHGCSGEFILLPNGRAYHQAPEADVICMSVTNETRYILKSWQLDADQIKLTYTSLVVDHCHTEECEKLPSSAFLSPVVTKEIIVNSFEPILNDRFTISFP